MRSSAWLWNQRRLGGVEGTDPITGWTLARESRHGSNGGFGSPEIHTTVFLERGNAKAEPQEVLVVECDGPMPHPYVLDNDANKGGCFGLTMTWPSAKHLDLTYETRHGIDVVFQAVRVGDVDITVEPVVSGPLPKASPYWQQTDSIQSPHS